MAVQDRNTLKTFFETGDIPSQNQFADLIDSLKHQNDKLTLSNEEIILIANRITNIDTAFIEYRSISFGNSIIKIEVTQQNAENQVIEIKSIKSRQSLLKQYFSGDAPYKIKLKEFQGEELNLNEYYVVYCELNQNYGIQRLLGNNLPILPEGFEFGIVNGNRCYFEVSKQNFEQELNIVHSNIKFINNTNVTIEYRAGSSYWGDIYRTKDTVTDHYNAWDYLIFSYNADMTNETHAIECKIYNSDTDELLAVGDLKPGQNNQNASGGATINEVRNIRIECTRQ